jgi:hypothetical protein
VVRLGTGDRSFMVLNRTKSKRFLLKRKTGCGSR